MKSIKPLTSLSTIVTIASVTPIIATSCSNDNSSEPGIKIASSGNNCEYDDYNRILKINEAGIEADIIVSLKDGSETSFKVDKSYGNNIKFVEGSKTGIKNKLSIGTSFTTSLTGQSVTISTENDSTPLTITFVVDKDPLNPSTLTAGDNVKIDRSILENPNIKYTIPYEGTSKDGSFTIKTFIPLTQKDKETPITVKAVYDKYSFNGKLGSDNQTFTFNIPNTLATTTTAQPLTISVTGAVEIVPDYKDATIEIDKEVRINLITLTNGKTYELIDDVDPNIFLTNEEKTYNIPTKNSGTQEIKCKEIESFILQNCDPNKKVIRTQILGFLEECSNMKTMDLSGLRHVTDVGNYFLLNCEGLKEIDLTPLSSVTTVGTSFVSGCLGADGIDISTLTNISYIDGDFFHLSFEVKYIKLPAYYKILGDALKEHTKEDIMYNEGTFYVPKNTTAAWAAGLDMDSKYFKEY